MKRIIVYSLLSVILLVLAACGSGKAQSPEEVIEVKQVLDWFPQPTHGGIYAAQSKGYFKDENLSVQIDQGGPQVSSPQIVASGKAEFGMTTGDALLQARDEGIPIVAVGAFMQKSPIALFFHKGEEIKDFSDLNDRSVFAVLYAPYWDYIKNKIDIPRVKEFEFTGQYTSFLADQSSVVQGYVTNTPYYMKQQNIEVDHLLVADTGYNPYMTVIFTTEKLAKENPELVKSYLKQVVKGFEEYKDNYAEINEEILKANPNQTIEILNEESIAQKEYVYGNNFNDQIGLMDEKRWEETIQQLYEIDVLKNKEDATNVFTNEFLPKNE